MGVPLLFCLCSARADLGVQGLVPRFLLVAGLLLGRLAPLGDFEVCLLFGGVPVFFMAPHLHGEEGV